MSNVGIVVGEGSVIGCTFYGAWDDIGYEALATDALAIEADGWWSNISSCKFTRANVELRNTQSCSIYSNRFYKSDIQIWDAVDLSVMGNTFEGNDNVNDFWTARINVSNSIDGFVISNNALHENSGIALNWNSPIFLWNGNISGNAFDGTSNVGIGMVGVPFGFDYIEVFDLNISGNVMSDWWGGGDMRINLGGGNDDSIWDLMITGNNIEGDDVNVVALPLIDITSESQFSGNITISDNILNGYAFDVWSVSVIGSDSFGLTSSRQSVTVSNNTLWASAGILVEDVNFITIADNYKPQPRGPSWSNYYSVRETGQIRAIASSKATVMNNYISSGSRASTTPDKAVIYVEAYEGKVSGNVVEGYDSAALDTGIIVDGAFFVNDNHYLGVGQRYATSETRFPNELVVRGDGSTIGINGMEVDTSAATSTTFLDLSETYFSMRGALAVTGGTLRLPFRQDVEIVAISAMVGTAPTGASVIVDVNLLGTSIFPTSTKPTIAASSVDSGLAVPDTTFVAADEYLTVDVDQVGSTVAGSDLSVLIQWRLA